MAFPILNQIEITSREDELLVKGVEYNSEFKTFMIHNLAVSEIP